MTTTVGRYELLRELGRGGMAEVFLARRRGPGGVEKRLALKRIRREKASDPRILEMFVQEARLSMTLAHKNIVPMFDFGRVGDELFLVMEYVDGVDLAAALESLDGAMHPVLAGFVAFEACQALDYAHRIRDEGGAERAIVHRDVTPRNVLLSLEGEVKLADFGIATNVTDLEGGKRIRGTPAYMAPEQARGEGVDARTDVFGLGLVLYQMLTGEKAYRADTKLAALELARRGEVPALGDDVPEALRAVVERATAPEPSERFESARAMQLALDAYIVSARASGSAPPGHRLAELVEGARPAARERAVSLAHAPTGPVVTFLDDGVGGLSTLAAGDGTMRSMAETAMESGDASESGVESDVAEGASVETKDQSPARRGVRLWPLVALGASAAAVAAFVVMRGGSTDGTTAPRAPLAAVEDAGAGAADRGGLALAGHDAAPRAALDAAVRVARAPADAREPRVITRPPPSKPDAAPVPGEVRVQVNPWAKVSVMGTAHGCVETPCKLTLPPGSYRLRLHNPQSNLGKTVEVTVESGKTAVVIETLTRAAGP